MSNYKKSEPCPEAGQIAINVLFNIWYDIYCSEYKSPKKIMELVEKELDELNEHYRLYLKITEKNARLEKWAEMEGGSDD